MAEQKLRSFIRETWSAIIKLIARFSMISMRSAGITLKSEITLNGLRRTWKLFVPELSNNMKVPLVIILHGRGGNGESMILLTRKGFNRLAVRDGFLVAYPDGIELNWNDGRKDEQSHDRAHSENIDDVGFISEMIEKLKKDYNIDPSKVYVTGISNGAIMCYRLACELSEKIAAIAPVDGNFPAMLLPQCSPLNPVSVLAINNTDDPLVPFDGGDIQGKFEKAKLGKVLSVHDSIAFWVKKNRCSTVPVLSDLPVTDPENDTRVIIKTYKNELNGDEVILYTVNGGGHTWPGGLQYMPSRVIGKTCMDFDANDVIWSFFKRHSRQEIKL